MTFNYKSSPFNLFILKEKGFRKGIFIRRQKTERFTRKNYMESETKLLDYNSEEYLYDLEK